MKIKIDLENKKVYGDTTKEETGLSLNILDFFNNENIDIIRDIFKEKVENNIMQNLLDNMKTIREKNKDIHISWIEFMNNLDENNRRILEESILQYTITTAKNSCCNSL